MSPRRVSHSTRVRARSFCSLGAVALGLEPAWFRRMVPVFGASHAVSALLLAVYMTGLAIGSALAAWLAPRTHRPLRAYALCELTVAVPAIASIPAFSLIEHTRAGSSLPLAALSAALVLLRAHDRDGAPRPSAARARARFIGELASLVAGRAVREQPRGRRARRGAHRLRALAPPRNHSRHHRLVYRRSHRRCGRGREREVGRHTQSNSNDESRATAAPHRALALVVLCSVGALSFALQVSLGRIAALLLGSTAYTFELLASVILVALALGAPAARDDQSALESWSSVTRRCVRIAVALFLAMLVVRIAPSYVQWLVRRAASPAPMRARPRGGLGPLALL